MNNIRSLKNICSTLPGRQPVYIPVFTHYKTALEALA